MPEEGGVLSFENSSPEAGTPAESWRPGPAHRFSAFNKFQQTAKEANEFVLPLWAKNHD